MSDYSDADLPNRGGVALRHVYDPAVFPGPLSRWMGDPGWCSEDDRSNDGEGPDLDGSVPSDCGVGSEPASDVGSEGDWDSERSMDYDDHVDLHGGGWDPDDGLDWDEFVRWNRIRRPDRDPDLVVSARAGDLEAVGGVCRQRKRKVINAARVWKGESFGWGYGKPWPCGLWYGDTALIAAVRHCGRQPASGDVVRALLETGVCDPTPESCHVEDGYEPSQFTWPPVRRAAQTALQVAKVGREAAAEAIRAVPRCKGGAGSRGC